MPNDRPPRLNSRGRAPSRGALPAITVGLTSLAWAAALGACSSTPSATSTTLDQAAATAAITDTVDTVFDGAAGTAGSKMALVQQAGSIEPALLSYFSSPPTRASTARVSQVVVLEPSRCRAEDLPWPCARVTDDILLAGQPSLSGEKTYLVESGGRWKVAKVTMCGLMALRAGGQTPPGC